jgi:hypothetical protein
VSRDFKDIKKKLDVVAIIGSRIELHKKGGDYWAPCPFHGEKTPSFKLDDRQGEWLWKCFGCNRGGDIVKFIEEFDHVNTATAIETLENMVSSRENKEWQETASKVQKSFKHVTEDNKPKKTFTVQDWEARVKPLWEPQGKNALKWLHEDRGLDDETIERMKLGYASSWKGQQGDWVFFPRIYGEKVVSVKMRTPDKKFTQVEGMDSRSMFNMDTVDALEPVYVTEGEIDACILEMCGFHAVSLMNSKHVISISDRILLKNAPRIFLAGDMDEQGKECAQRLLRDLGENTHIIEWPEGCKDANDLFRGPGERDVMKTRELVKQLSDEAKKRLPEGFTSLLERLRQSDDANMLEDEDRLHFPKNMGLCDRMTFTPRGGVMVLYSTYSGTGKSMLKSQILLAEARRGQVVADLSPEIRDQEYLALVTSQVVGPLVGGLPRTSKIEKSHFLQAAKILDQNTEKGTPFEYYVGHEVMGTTEDEVLEFIEGSIKIMGVTRLAIDTFHRLITNADKNQVQAEGSMVKKLEKIAIKYGTIIMLICQSNAEAEGLDNLKKNAHGVLRGSREIRDIPCAIYLLHRNIRPQKDGENPDDILEKEAGLFAKKTRFKGPGFPQVKLLLQQENSLFVEGSLNGDPGPQSAPPEAAEDNSFSIDSPFV